MMECPLDSKSNKKEVRCLQKGKDPFVHQGAPSNFLLHPNQTICLIKMLNFEALAKNPFLFEGGKLIFIRF